MKPTIETAPNVRALKPRIAVMGVGGGSGNAVTNMIAQKLQSLEFIVANSDAQALARSNAPQRVNSV